MGPTAYSAAEPDCLRCRRCCGLRAAARCRLTPTHILKNPAEMTMKVLMHHRRVIAQVGPGLEFVGRDETNSRSVGEGVRETAVPFRPWRGSGRDGLHAAVPPRADLRDHRLRVRVQRLDLRAPGWAGRVATGNRGHDPGCSQRRRLELFDRW